jgi:hypothetical protein
MNELTRIKEPQDDDFTLVTNFHELPKEIVFYYGFSERPYIKLNKRQVWDGADKLNATQPSCLNHVVKIPRILFDKYIKTKKQINNEELLNLALQYQ